MTVSAHPEPTPRTASTTEFCGEFDHELLHRVRGRASTYDRENTFFRADFAELLECGYLAAPAPQSVGGGGLTLAQLSATQRRLAAHGPATALGVNMHLVWVQVARMLHDRGDHRLDWVLRDAVAGEVFAFGISEAGNDAVLLDAKSVARPLPDGGYAVTGTKIFTTLSPVWTRLGLHARVESAVAEAHPADEPHTPTTGAPDAPHLMFGFVTREGSDPRTPDEAAHGLRAGKLSHPGVWDPLGMRASQSYTTHLEDVLVAPERVAAIMPAYDGADPLMFAIFASFSLLTASVYAGIGDRALELATEAAAAERRGADGVVTTKLEDPDTASRLTAATLAHRQALNTLELLIRDVDARTDRTDWFVALAAAKNQVVDAAQHVVAQAMRVVGAASYVRTSELARLSRDVLAGSFHPSSPSALARMVRGGFVAN